MNAEHDDFTSDQLAEIIRRLEAEWRRDRAGRAFASAKTPAVVVTVFALAAHAHRLGGAVLALHDAGLRLEAVPLVRAAFESALLASWIQQIPDAAPAFMNRNHNQQKALRDTAHKARWFATTDGSHKIPADELPPFDVAKQSGAGAKSTEELCKDLRVGHQAYALFRGLSWFTHPTAAVVDLYLRLTADERSATLQIAPDLDEEFDVPWLHVMASSMVWSARALNLLDAERGHSGERQRLRRAAQELRIIEVLLSTDEAVRRGKKSAREHAASWSAPHDDERR